MLLSLQTAGFATNQDNKNCNNTSPCAPSVNWIYSKRFEENESGLFCRYILVISWLTYLGGSAITTDDPPGSQLRPNAHFPIGRPALVTLELSGNDPLDGRCRRLSRSSTVSEESGPHPSDNEPGLSKNLCRVELIILHRKQNELRQILAG